MSPSLLEYVKLPGIPAGNLKVNGNLYWPFSIYLPLKVNALNEWSYKGIPFDDLVYS